MSDTKKPFMLNHDSWKMAAPGAGAIYYQRMAESRSFRAWLSMRTSNVGEGYGITGGGFVECAEIDKMEVGSVVQTVDHAWRECMEENAGFEHVIDKDSFLIRARPASLLLARADDINRVHSASLYGIPALDDAEWHRIGALPAGLDKKGNKEREDRLREVHVTWDGAIDPREPQRYITMAEPGGKRIWQDDFNYAHEFHGVASIAWNIENPRAW